MLLHQVPILCLLCLKIMLESIENADYFSNLFVSQYLADGNAELLLVYLLCNGETPSVPFLIAFLLVGWNRVMD